MRLPSFQEGIIEVQRADLHSKLLLLCCQIGSSDFFAFCQTFVLDWEAKQFTLYGISASVSPARYPRSKFQVARSESEPAPPYHCIAKEQHIEPRQSLHVYPWLQSLFPSDNSLGFPAVAKATILLVSAAALELRRLFREAWCPQPYTKQLSSDSGPPNPRSCGQRRSFLSTYRTNRSTLLIVCGALTRQTFGMNPISMGKSENCVFQITLPASRPVTTVFILFVRTSLGTPPKILECIQHATLYAAQITVPYKFNVF